MTDALIHFLERYTRQQDRVIARLQADLELARLALEGAVVLLDEHKFKDVWTP
jgi:hypothetical protein